MSDITEDGYIFEEPIEVARGPQAATLAMVARVRGLEKFPGKWAKINTWQGQSAAYEAKRKIDKANVAEQIEGFELAVRREKYANGKGEGGSVLYARYIGKT